MSRAARHRVARTAGRRPGAPRSPCKSAPPGSPWSLGRKSSTSTGAADPAGRSSPVLHFSAIMGEEHRAAGGGALSTPDRACRALAAFLGAGPREVECAYVFGSRSRGQAGPLSDFDLGIVVREALSPQARLELAAALTEQSERLTHERVDVVILNDAPPALRHRAVRDGILLFARDDGARVAFEARAIREFLDFEPVLERYDRALRPAPGPAALALDH